MENPPSRGSPGRTAATSEVNPVRVASAAAWGKLGDVYGDAPRLVASEEMRRRAPPRLLLKVGVGERLPVGVADDEPLGMADGRSPNQEVVDPPFGRASSDSFHGFPYFLRLGDDVIPDGIPFVFGGRVPSSERSVRRWPNA